MITWATPWAFVLLIPVLLWLPLHRRVGGVNRLAVASTEAMEGGWTLRLLLSWVPDVMRMVALVLAVFALARPQTISRETLVESEGLDIMLAVDTSGSMEQQDFRVGARSVNRLTVAKAVIREFVSERPYDRIGVVVFGEQAFTHVPLTLDHDTLLRVLEETQIGMAGPRGTAIGSSIAVASKRLKDLEAPGKIVILLTDGQNNAGRIGPMQAAEASKALGIRVYTIGVGGGGGGFFQQLMSDGIDEQTLTQIAETTGAKYFRADDTEALQEIFTSIDELEPSPAEVEELVDEEERFRMFLVPAVLLFFLEWLLRTTWLRRWP